MKTHCGPGLEKITSHLWEVEILRFYLPGLLIRELFQETQQRLRPAASLNFLEIFNSKPVDPLFRQIILFSLYNNYYIDVNATITY